MKSNLVLGLLVLVTPLIAAPAFGAEEAAAFSPTTTTGEYRVETGLLEGLLRADGKSIGFVPLVYGAAETPLAKPPGVFNYYRVFTTNKRYGDSMRVVTSKTTLRPDGALEVVWPAAEERPFTLTAIYRWTSANTVDVETIVTAAADLPDFEVFLASYFAEGFPATRVYAKAGEAGNPAFMTASEEAGTWQVFPRDAAALGLVEDGRWTIPPSPVDWAVPSNYAYPLAYRRHAAKGLVAMVMAPREDCFALFTPCTGESHRSMYLSLFGRSLAKGETARAFARFVVADALSENQMLEHYKAYEAQTKAWRER